MKGYAYPTNQSTNSTSSSPSAVDMAVLMPYKNTYTERSQCHCLIILTLDGHSTHALQELG